MCENTQNSILRISEKKTMELLDLYEKEECLWNTVIPDYKNKYKRARAAESIAKKLNVKDFEARHVMIKFKNLRNSYCQKLKKINSSITGEEAVVYQPRVVWFDKMNSFLRPHLQCARVTRAQQVQDKNEEHIKRESEVVDDTSTDNITWSNDITVDSFFTPESNQDESCSDTDVFLETYTNQIAKRSQNWYTESSKKLKTEDNRRDLEHTLKNTSPHPHRDNLKEDGDYFDSFGKYIAALLRSLPKKKALVLQPQIVDLIASTVHRDIDDDHI
ncbi:uncharacterized protein ACR2FA_008472 [Aphomia sociella]